MFHRPLPRTLPAAIRDAGSAKIAVRRAAVVDLARYAEDNPEDVGAALQKALRDSDPLVRTDAAYALGVCGLADALPGLVVAMDDTVLGVRQAAIEALGQIGDSRAMARLLRALKDDRPDVRFQSLIALMRLSQEDGTEAALHATIDEDPHVRYIALRLIEELFDDEDRPVEVRIELPPEHRDAAVRCLKDADAAVRTAAAIVLARAGNEAGAGVIVEVLEDRLAVQAEDEAAAVAMAGALGLRAAIPALERRAFGMTRFVRERYAWNACVSLASMGHDRAKQTILRELGAWTLDRRTLAVTAAGKAGLREARPLIEGMRGDETKADGAAVDRALALL